MAWLLIDSGQGAQFAVHESSVCIQLVPKDNKIRVTILGSTHQSGSIQKLIHFSIESLNQIERFDDYVALHAHLSPDSLAKTLPPTDPKTTAVAGTSTDDLPPGVDDLAGEATGITEPT